VFIFPIAAANNLRCALRLLTRISAALQCTSMQKDKVLSKLKLINSIIRSRYSIHIWLKIIKSLLVFIKTQITAMSYSVKRSTINLYMLKIVFLLHLGNKLRMQLYFCRGRAWYSSNIDFWYAIASLSCLWFSGIIIEWLYRNLRLNKNAKIKQRRL